MPSGGGILFGWVSEGLIEGRLVLLHFVMVGHLVCVDAGLTCRPGAMKPAGLETHLAADEGMVANAVSTVEASGDGDRVQA